MENECPTCSDGNYMGRHCVDCGRDTRNGKPGPAVAGDTALGLAFRTFLESSCVAAAKHQRLEVRISIDREDARIDARTDERLSFTQIIDSPLDRADAQFWIGAADALRKFATDNPLPMF